MADPVQAPESTAFDAAASTELRRIQRVYEQRQTDKSMIHATPLDLRGRCAVHEHDELFLRIMLGRGVATLAGLKILDVGCGSGAQLRRFFDFGAAPNDCFGADVLKNRLVLAKKLSPGICYTQASGALLPFPDQSFDLVFQTVVFTSVLDQATRQTMAREILRVLRRDGCFFWYDFAFNNPRNADVRGIGLREVHSLFPGCRIQSWKLTLAPPIGRAVARFSSTLYYMLSQIPFLRTHYLCLVEKNH